MIKDLKKRTKSFLLALCFATSSAISMLAVEPQKSESTKTTQTCSAQKRKRENHENDSQRLNELYDFDNMVSFLFHSSEPHTTFCEIIEENGSPCNQPLEYFYLVPKKSGGMACVGRTCIKKFAPEKETSTSSQNAASRIYISDISILTNPKLQTDLQNATKILKYFFDQKNWNIRSEHGPNGEAQLSRKGNFTLNLKGLESIPKIENPYDRIAFKTSMLANRFCISKYSKNKYRCDNFGKLNNTEATEKHKDIINFYLNHPLMSTICKSKKLITSPIPFTQRYALSDDKIFEAFDFFCKIYNFYQPFKIIPSNTTSSPDSTSKKHKTIHIRDFINTDTDKIINPTSPIPVKRARNTVIKSRKMIAVEKIRDYFLDVDNWQFDSLGRHILYLRNISEDKDCKNFIKCIDPHIMVYFNTNICSEHPYPYGILYNGNFYEQLPEKPSDSGNARPRLGYNLKTVFYNAYILFCRANKIY